ncbi:MAG TPA: hypothetical protein VKW78_01115, partial [Terriglobales bacterium]|nr:hypothetical protein [Terriglobales bacterium]
AAHLEPGEDVVLYGDGDKQTVHLTKHACKQILGWAGITVQLDSTIQEKKYEGVDGPYIDFEAWATWLTPDGRYYRAMGNRSSYDDFFAKRTRYVCPHEDCRALTEFGKGCPKHGRVTPVKEAYYLPISEVDLPSIKQAAITNLWNHIVEDAGLKPSKRELEAIGFRFDAVKERVSFSSAQAPLSASSAASKGAAKTPAAKPADAAPSPRPKPTEKTELPIGKGIVSEAYKNTTRPKNGKGGGKPYVKVVQNGHFLFCYHDKEVETRDGAKNILDLIANSVGQFCDFIVDSKQRGDEQINYINGARRIGVHSWNDDGTPIIPQRQPGDDGYQADDEDIPF